MPSTRRIGRAASSRAHAALVAGLVLLLATLLAAPTAHAQSPDALDVEALGLEVTLGIDDLAVVGTWTPLTVRLAPERPFTGRLLVSVDGETGRILERRDVEVAGTGQKVFRFLLPPSTGVAVQVVADGAADAVTVRPSAGRPDGFLVGVLPGVAVTDIAATGAANLDQRAVAVTLDPELLALGPRALEAVSTIVARDADLRALPDAARDAIVARVAGGGHLVVVAPTAADLDLPWSPVTAVGAALEPAPGAWGASRDALFPGRRGGDAADAVTYAAGRAGAGRITVVTELPNVADDPALWEPLLQPSPLSTSFERGRSTISLVSEIATVALTGDRDLTLPSVGLMALFFGAYLLVVGPLNGVVLARIGRRELAWVTIPAVTLIFAVAAFFGATGTRPAVGASARAAWWIGDSGANLTLTAVQSPRQGQHTVDLSGDWDVSTVNWGSRALVERTPDTRVTIDLAALETGVLAGWQPAAGPAPLAVEAAIVDDELRLEVTNRSTAAITDLTVRAATVERLLAGELAPGATHVETLPLPSELPTEDPFAFDQALFDRDRGEGVGALRRALAWDVIDGTPGLVWVTGRSTADLGLPVPTVDGRRADDAGTFLAVATTPTATDDRTSPFEVQRDLLVDGNGIWMPSPLAVEGSGGHVLRWWLPHEGEVDRLLFSLDRGQFDGGFDDRMPVACHEVETRDADGNLLRVDENCEAEVCSPDAVSCETTGNETTVCFDDGTCQVHLGLGGDVGVRADLTGLQLWDRVERRWVDLDLATASAATRDVGRWMSPLGEVLARTAGGGMFDVSGRGVGALPGGAA